MDCSYCLDMACNIGGPTAISSGGLAHAHKVEEYLWLRNSGAVHELLYVIQWSSFSSTTALGGEEYGS